MAKCTEKNVFNRLLSLDILSTLIFLGFEAEIIQGYRKPHLREIPLTVLPRHCYCEPSASFEL